VNGGTRATWFQLAGEWIRHHTGSFLATCVDFAVMIALVEILDVGPVAATATGALAGALTSFLLGRSWVFRAEASASTGQAIRYALVAMASLALNSGGEHVLVQAGLGYVKARVIVAVAVSNLWNYPLHKFFVFARKKDAHAT
jgi:putative flippase GtrA